MISSVLLKYGLPAGTTVNTFGHGLINNTWVIENGTEKFIVQRINTAVFKHPEYISENIDAIAAYLATQFPGYFFCTPCKALDGSTLIYEEGEGFFRMFPFIHDSHALVVAENTAQTYEAARKFGEFTKLLAGFPEHTLKITLPDFHNISLRYENFLKATASGHATRTQQSASLVEFLKNQKHIVSEYEAIKASGHLKQRVTHHDTKISNVLLDNADKGICVIDLDTVMPGYFISDVGDMIRTYVSPYGEEEKDLSKLQVREDYFIAIAEGYLQEMHSALNEVELNHFVFAGKFMIYMQALRFITDHLNNDVYYGARYEGHNFVRASNQAHLLQLLIEKEEKLQAIVLDIATRTVN